MGTVQLYEWGLAYWNLRPEQLELTFDSDQLLAFWAAANERQNDENRNELSKLWFATREAYLSVRSPRYRKPWFLQPRGPVDPVARERQLDAFLARHGAGNYRP